ncbi:MAG: phosphatase PAP2 family protein [Agathobacter sp.]
MVTSNFELRRQKYTERMTYIKGKSSLHKLLRWGNLIFSGIVYVAYPLLLLILLVQKNPILYRAIIVPLDSFIILSVARYFINRKRPYELYECEPAIHRDKKGNSFPSRHVFCVFVIATTFVGAGFPLAGILLFLVGVGIAGIRVYCGVHFFSDVVVGAVIGVLCGVIGFWGI